MRKQHKWLCLFMVNIIDFWRERHRSASPLIYAFLAWPLHGPWLWMEPTTMVYQDDALTDWATWPGLSLHGQFYRWSWFFPVLGPFSLLDVSSLVTPTASVLLTTSHLFRLSLNISIYFRKICFWLIALPPLVFTSALQLLASPIAILINIFTCLFVYLLSQSQH